MSDTEDARPDDLISIPRAATIAERSERTVRRWASPEVGKLQRWEGELPVTGGPAPVLVSEKELMVLLASSGQKPRESKVPSPDTTQDTALTGAQDTPTSAPDSVQVAVLEGRLQVAEVRAELGVVTAERDGLVGQVQDLREQLRQMRDQVADLHRRSDTAHAELRSDLVEERDRSRALEAELTALRQLHGASWWRKLLGGPVAALPAGS